MKIKSIALVTLALLSLPAVAQSTPDISIVNTINQSISASASSIMPKAIAWLSSFMALQFVITNFGLLKSGADIEAIIGKLIGSLAWFGVCFYLISNGPDFINSVGTDLLNIFASNIPSPSSVISVTLALCSSLLVAIAVTGTSVVGTGNTAIANVLILVLMMVFSIGMLMVIKIMMLSLELALVVMLSPLSFSLLGLNALKDQGISPLKSLISLAYRIILLGILCTAFTNVITTAGNDLNAITWADPTKWGAALKTIFSATCSYPIIAYFVFKSDSIASSLASGTTNLGTADVASAAAMGASAGAVAASGGASVVGGAGKASQTMMDFFKGLSHAGSVSNASSSGAGPSPIGPAPMGAAPAAASMSLGSGGASASTANKPPSRSTSGVPAPSENGPSRSSSGSAGANTESAKSQTSGNGNTSSSPQRMVGTPGGSGSAASSSSSGSAANAGIGAPGAGLEQRVSDLVDVLSQPKNGASPGDRFSQLNDHVERERASVGVSINTHHSD